MSQAPVVSVVIPCYNARKTLAETVESVFCQSFKDYEIIVVDDGSTDGSQEIIRSFGGRVHPFCGPQRGASAARNIGTKLSQGQFIQYLDADDTLYPQALETRVKALKEADAQVAYADWLKLEEDENGVFREGRVVAWTMEDVHPDPEIAIFTRFHAPPAALLYRRDIVNRIGEWNESLPIIQDARFFFDAALHKARFLHVPGVSAAFRSARGGTLSTKDPAAFVKDVFTHACQVEAIWRNRGPLDEDRRNALGEVYGYAARMFFQYDFGQFKKVMRKIKNLDSSFRWKYPQLAEGLSKWLGRRAALFMMNGLVFLHRRLGQKNEPVDR